MEYINAQSDIYLREFLLENICYANQSLVFHLKFIPNRIHT